MNKNICKYCKKEYEDYFDETILNTEKEYCILHCDKSNWTNLEGKEFKFRYDSFWDEINNIILKKNERNDLILEYGEANYVMTPYAFENINFSFFHFKKLGNTSYATHTPDGEENCIYNIFNGIEPNIDIIFNNCIFEEEIDFTSLKFANNIIFKETCNLKKGINFSNNSFTHNITIKALNSVSISCQNTIFDKYVDFSNLTINTLILDNTTFNENLNLLKSKLVTPLDLTNAIIKSNINLLNFNCEVANRQTARIIKNEFDKQGDIINANIFYAKEMKQREKELQKDLKEGQNFFEYLVFKLHGLSSNHSQDWLLALFWMISFSFISSFIKILDCSEFTLVEKTIISSIIFSIIVFINIHISNTKKIYYVICSIIYYFLYSILTKDYTLNIFSNMINPSSIMIGKDELTFGILIYKITLAYLIYQLIISIRQNTRRK